MDQLSWISSGLKKKLSFLGSRVMVIAFASNGSPSIENHETCKQQIVLMRRRFGLFHECITRPVKANHEISVVIVIHNLLCHLWSILELNIQSKTWPLYHEQSIIKCPVRTDSHHPSQDTRHKEPRDIAIPLDKMLTQHRIPSIK